MKNYEKKLDAVIRYLMAETEEDRVRARCDLKHLQTLPATDHVCGSTVIEDILLDIGVPCHIKGHAFLVTAIKAVVSDAESMDAVTSVLYPFVASLHNTTASRVERAIRHAIEVAWERGDIDTMQRYFGNTVSPCKGKPTNSEFIARAANVVRMRMNEAA